MQSIITAKHWFGKSTSSLGSNEKEKQSWVSSMYWWHFTLNFQMTSLNGVMLIMNSLGKKMEYCRTLRYISQSAIAKYYCYLDKVKDLKCHIFRYPPFCLRKKQTNKVWPVIGQLIQQDRAIDVIATVISWAASIINVEMSQSQHSSKKSTTGVPNPKSCNSCVTCATLGPPKLSVLLHYGPNCSFQMIVKG